MVKIFVGNCPETSTGDDLHYFFSRYGKVSQADVLNTKRYGFVHMDSQDEAEAAVRALDGSDLKGSKIRVELSIPKRDGGGPMRGGSRARGGGGSFGGRSGGGDRDSFGRGRDRNGRGGSSFSPRSGGGGRGRPGFSPRRRDDDYGSRGGGSRYMDDGGRGRRFNDASPYGGGGYSRESSRRYEDTPYARDSSDAYSQRYRQTSPSPRGDSYSRPSYDRAPSPQMGVYRGSFGTASAYDGRRSPLPPTAVDYERRSAAASVGPAFVDQRRQMAATAMGVSAAELGYERRQPAAVAIDPYASATSYYQQTRTRSPSPPAMAAARPFGGVSASDIRQQPARYYADPYADPYASRSYPNALSRSPPRGQPAPRQMM